MYDAFCFCSVVTSKFDAKPLAALSAASLHIHRAHIQRRHPTTSNTHSKIFRALFLSFISSVRRSCISMCILCIHTHVLGCSYRRLCLSSHWNVMRETKYPPTSQTSAIHIYCSSLRHLPTNPPPVKRQVHTMSVLRIYVVHSLTKRSTRALQHIDHAPPNLPV